MRGLVMAAVGCAFVLAGAAPASEGVVWQGRTPQQGSAFVAGIGRELRIPLEAAGPVDSSLRIRMERFPRGSRLVSRPEALGTAVFRWRPSVRQLGEWQLVFTASDGIAAAQPLKLRVHVGRRATRTFRLSSARAISRSATLLHTANALARPVAGARTIVHLRAHTPEHVPHVVYLVGGTIDPHGRYWLRVRLPVLPNGTTGWIPRDAVGSFLEVDAHLVIDRSRFLAILYRRGRPVFHAVIGVGQAQWPTPPGRFYVRERLTGFTDPIYGSLAFGTNARSDVLTDWPGGGFIGVHGTNQPEILPGRVSHGCIRLKNEDILRLARLMPVGTPLTVS
ncbi:MAG TPA: L,D-transpeptidase [Gaiellaceae bacterium]|nr:L,D-transpeptidase [Gaiellaceae bacterium]